MPGSIKNRKRMNGHGSADAPPTSFGERSPSLQHQRFSDLDELIEAARGWDLEIRRIDHSPFTGRIAQFDLGDVRYGLSQLSSPMEQFGSPPPGRWSFIIPESPMVWKGRMLTPGMIPICRPGSEMEIVSRPGFCVLPITLEPQTLARLCAELNLPNVERLIESCDVVMVDPARFDRLVRVLRNMWASVAADPNLLTGQYLQHDLLERIPAMLLQTLANAGPMPRMRESNQLIKKCLDAIAFADVGEITVGDLARATGVSERAVRYAFTNHFAVSPKTYLKARQINEVRRQILAAPRGVRISEIAGVCGYWHMGQFAVDYKRMFGELPSQTARHTEQSGKEGRRIGTAD